MDQEAWEPYLGPLSRALCKAELEGELGHDGLVRLRQMLVALNRSKFVRTYRGQTRQRPAVAD
jgi:hypothetical protein